VGGADESFNSGWTKPGWETVKAVPSFGKPKKVFESPLLVSPGAFTKTDKQHLEVISDYLGDLFKKPDARVAVLDDLKTCQKIGAVGLNSPVMGAPWSGLASLPGPRLSHPDSPVV
jgi:hypothetical protein